MVVQKARQMAPQNCGPLSEVMAAGTPNRFTQAVMRREAALLHYVKNLFKM